MTDIDSLAESLINGDRTALSRAITLVESENKTHRDNASALMEKILPHRKPSVRIGITGTPGVGKSTFIESFGLYLVKNRGLKIAVLAIDPTSTRTKGSILGDKTRMSELSREPHVYIRPSPSKGSLGGVAAATMESIYLLEAAGFDVIIVETVGVGQSETAVHGMVDFFLLLIQPGSGDQLQGIKRGIMEMADGILVNKADGSLKDKAIETSREYYMAAQLMPAVREDWRTRVMYCSAIEGQGIDKVWEMVREFEDKRKDAGTFEVNRKVQEIEWFDHALSDGLLGRMEEYDDWNKGRNGIREKIKAGEISPFQGAEWLLATVDVKFRK